MRSGTMRLEATVRVLSQNSYPGGILVDVILEGEEEAVTKIWKALQEFQEKELH
jgi:hypothetical protein